MDRGKSGGTLRHAALVLGDGPDTQLAEEVCQGGGLVVGVEAAGVGEYPGVTATEEWILQADMGIFVARDNAIGMNADKGDHCWTPAFDFGGEALAAGAEFVIGQLVGAGGGAFDDVGNAEVEFKQKRFVKWGEKARGKAAVVESGPEAITRAAEVAAYRGGVEAGVDAGEEHNKVFGDKVGDQFIMCRENLSSCRFPGCG